MSVDKNKLKPEEYGIILIGKAMKGLENRLDEGRAKDDKDLSFKTGQLAAFSRIRQRLIDVNTGGDWSKKREVVIEGIKDLIAYCEQRTRNSGSADERRPYLDYVNYAGMLSGFRDAKYYLSTDWENKQSYKDYLKSPEPFDDFMDAIKIVVAD